MRKIVRLCCWLLGLGMLLACEPQTPEFEQLLVYPKNTPLAPFALQSHDKKDFNQESLKQKWDLIFMGYTHCPDVCPLTLTDMAKIYEQLPESAKKKFQVVFLSVDPARDSLEHLAEYIDYFNQDFIAVTGEKSQIDKLVFSLGGIYSINNEDPAYYSVDHSARIFIVNPQGERFGIISSEAMHNKDKSKLIAELAQLAEF